MRLFVLFCTLVCFITVSTNNISAQLRVGEDGNVAVGGNVNPNQKMFVLNTEETTAFSVNSSGVSNATRFGIYNLVRSGGNGARYGIYNYLLDNQASSSSTATAYGIQNKMSITTRSRSIGFSNEIINLNPSSSDVIYGFHSVVHPSSNSNGSAKMYGVYSDIQGVNNYAGYFTGKMHINGEFTLTSDASLKTNSDEVENAIDILRKLNPQSYTFKKGNRFGYEPNLTHYGFMAQDVESVLPSIVSDIQHPAVYLEEGENLTLDKEGTPIENKETTSKAPTEKFPAETLKAIRYLDLIAILTQAVKDQQEQIEDQVSDYEDLEGELFDLKSEMKQYREVLSRLAECAGCVSADNKPLEDEGQVTPVGIQLFPNPANESFTIQHANDAGFGIRLYTVDGKLVQELPFAIGSKQIDTSALPAGNYIVEVVDAANKTVEKQIVIVAH